MTAVEFVMTSIGGMTAAELTGFNATLSTSWGIGFEPPLNATGVREPRQPIPPTLDAGVALDIHDACGCEECERGRIIAACWRPSP